MIELSPDDMPVVIAVDALRLMREALALLDRAGAAFASSPLQHAIDTLDPPPTAISKGPIMNKIEHVLV